MKRLLLAVTCVAVLSGCAAYRSLSGGAHQTAVVVRPMPLAERAPELASANGETITRVPFRPGVSSVTVENMAKKKGCTGGAGAGLITAPGPVEVYRMMCENRTVYTAKCELRQCKAM